MFFKKKAETKGGAGKAPAAGMTAGPQTAVEIPPAAPAAQAAAKVEPAPAAPAPAATAAAVAPNALRNGDFSTWSRGERFEEIRSQQAIVDDWVIGFGAGNVKTVNVSRGAPPPGVEGNALVVEVTEPGDGTGWFALQHRIQDVRPFAGRKITISFWTRSPDLLHEPTRIGIGIRQNYGEGTTSIDTWGRSEVIEENWRHHTIDLDLPAAATTGAWERTVLGIDLALPRGKQFKLEIADVFME